MVKEQKIRKYLFFLLIIFLLLFFYVWQQIQVVRLGYRIEEVKKEISNLDNENANLRIQVTRLSSLENVEQIAREKLKMGPAKSENIIILPLEGK